LVLETIALNSESFDPTKVEKVKNLKKNKTGVWVTFIIFGWSYGSFGKIGWQIAWYTLLIFTVYNLWVTFNTNFFDVYSGMAIMGAIVFFLWYVVRLFTLNRSIDKFNQDLADLYYLTPEERAEVGID